MITKSKVCDSCQRVVLELHEVLSYKYCNSCKRNNERLMNGELPLPLDYRDVDINSIQPDTSKPS